MALEVVEMNDPRAFRILRHVTLVHHFGFFRKTSPRLAATTKFAIARGSGVAVLAAVVV
jgi:hypothetical protein